MFNGYKTYESPDFHKLATPLNKLIFTATQSYVGAELVLLYLLDKDDEYRMNELMLCKVYDVCRDPLSPAFCMSAKKGSLASSYSTQETFIENDPDSSKVMSTDEIMPLKKLLKKVK